MLLLNSFLPFLLYSGIIFIFSFFKQKISGELDKFFLKDKIVTLLVLKMRLEEEKISFAIWIFLGTIITVFFQGGIIPVLTKNNFLFKFLKLIGR